MKIFISGSNGFIGSHLVRNALSHGHEVVALRRSDKPAKIALPQEPIWITKSLEDDLKEVLESCDVVVHLAAYGVNPTNTSWREAFRWNVSASVNLWEQAYQVGVKRIIIVGSCSEYGKSAERYEKVPCDAPLEPVNSYGASKAAATLAAIAFAKEKEIEIAVLRLFHVYGEGEESCRFWPSLKKAAIEGNNFPMTLGEQIRDFAPVEFVAEKLLEFATKASIEKGMPIIKNIGTGTQQSLIEFAEKYWMTFGAKGRLVPGKIPYRIDEVMRYIPEI